MKAEDYQDRQEKVLDWTINIVSYKLGDRYFCTVDNVDPGARLSKGEGATREEAEAQAVEKATRYIANTRRFAV
jgi:hypothetical protein